MSAPEENLRDFDCVLAANPNDAGAHYQRAMIRLSLGDFSAWEEYEYRWKTPAFSESLKASGRFWDGRSNASQTLFAFGEQGIGDVFQFVRYLPLVKERCARLMFGCQKNLHHFFKPLADDMLSPRSDFPPYDSLVPLMSLPWLLNLPLPGEAPKPPYVKSNDQYSELWRSRLPTRSGLKVGIAWQGNPKNKDDAARSFPLVAMAPLMDVPGVSVVSLQVAPGDEQLRSLDWPVTSFGDDLDRDYTMAFKDTAAILSSLDLLIACDSAVAHLAGAMNVTTWLALAAVPDWRWGLSGEHTPWYPRTRLFRQKTPGEWGDVFARISTELRRLV